MAPDTRKTDDKYCPIYWEVVDIVIVPTAVAAAADELHTSLVIY